MKRHFLVCAMVLAIVGSTEAQFLETFDDQDFRVDPRGVEGWAFFSGDGAATIDFRSTGKGHASILVDATSDRRNIWWALIQHRVSEGMDLEQLARPGWEVRVEARIRSSHAPRRVNLHVNTQRTTDFHSHLMEFDIPVAETWHTISMTTRSFPVQPGDAIRAQMALMDWGHGRYRVDVDYFKVDVVEAAQTGPDLGEQVPYHPPIPDVDTYKHMIPAAESAVIDFAHPDVNLGTWSIFDGDAKRRVLMVSGTTWVVLRWDLEAFAGQRPADNGLLELTTHSVQRNADQIEDFGLIRVVEILDGEPEWRRATVSVESLLRGGELDEVFNPQMIIDWPANETAGGKTGFTISQPVLQRLIDGKTLGIAITPLESINASFEAAGADAPRLLFNTEEIRGE